MAKQNPKLYHQDITMPMDGEDIGHKFDWALNVMEPDGTERLDLRVICAHRYIMDEDTVQFKDLYYPSNAQIVLYHRLDEKIVGHLRMIKANCMYGDFMNIVKAYRRTHSKEDDIKFLLRSFDKLQLLSQKLADLKIDGKVKVPKLQRIDAEAVPECRRFKKLNRRMPLPEIAMGNDVVAPPVQEKEPKMKRHNTVRRVVRFAMPGDGDAPDNVKKE